VTVSNKPESSAAYQLHRTETCGLSVVSQSEVQQAAHNEFPDYERERSRVADARGLDSCAACDTCEFRRPVRVKLTAPEQAWSIEQLPKEGGWRRWSTLRGRCIETLHFLWNVAY